MVKTNIKNPMRPSNRRRTAIIITNKTIQKYILILEQNLASDSQKFQSQGTNIIIIEANECQPKYGGSLNSNGYVLQKNMNGFRSWTNLFTALEYRKPFMFF